MTNAEALRASRLSLLQAGAQLLVEEAQRSPFAALRVRALCDRAGYTTGAFYVHWDDVDGYHAALSSYLLAEDEELFAADFSTLTDLAHSTNADNPVEAVAAVANKDFELLLGNPLWDAMELFNVTWGRTRYKKAAAKGYKRVDKSTA